MTIHLFTMSKYKHDLEYLMEKTRSGAGRDQLLSVLVGMLLASAPGEPGVGLRAGAVRSPPGCELLQESRRPLHVGPRQPRVLSLPGGCRV